MNSQLTNTGEQTNSGRLTMQQLEESERSWDLWLNDVCSSLDGMPQFERPLRPRFRRLFSFLRDE